MLKTNNLEVSIDGKKILKGLNLNVNKGEVHAIMGPNGSGKSTLSMTVAGHPDYKVEGGEIIFEGQNILELEPFERAQLGIFLGFQYPVEIPGLNNNYFLQNALNAVRKSSGLVHVDAFDFQSLVKDKLNIVGLSEDFLSRGVNTGFSGGEKKKNEIFQLLVLNPKLAVLDETDSGLDIDALKTVAEGVNYYRNSENAVVLVTHYQRLLNYIQPDFVHILIDGKIVQSGDFTLAQKIEAEGYDWLRQKVEDGGVYA